MLVASTDTKRVSRQVDSWRTAVRLCLNRTVTVGILVLFFAGITPASQENENLMVIEAELRKHFSDLVPISARAERQVEYVDEVVSEETLSWLRTHYMGATIDWRRDSSATYALDRTPDGKPYRASIFRDGATTVYGFADHTATKLPYLNWNDDLNPGAYFLDLPPVPYRHFLSTADQVSPTAHERSIGATSALLVRNPGVEMEQRIRVALRRDPVQILSIELLYTSPAGEEILAERFLYSDWTEVNGGTFPLKHCKEIIENGQTYMVKCLELDDPGAQPVPDDLLVTSGSTYKDKGSDSAVVLVGSTSHGQIAQALRDVVDWASTRPSTQLFQNPEIDIYATVDRLAEIDSIPPTVPLQDGIRGNNDCGPTCLSLALALQNGVQARLSIVEAFREKASESGSSVEDVARFATLAGLHALPVRSDMGTLISLGRPVVLPVVAGNSSTTPNHFVLLVGESRGKPVIMNPPTTAFTPTDAWLATHWNGDGLILSSDVIPGRQWSTTSALLAISCMVVIAAILGISWKKRKN